MSAAIEHYRRAILIDSQEPAYHHSLGVALLKGGNPRAAVTAFKAAIGLHEAPGSPEAARLKQTLAERGFPIV